MRKNAEKIDVNFHRTGTLNSDVNIVHFYFDCCLLAGGDKVFSLTDVEFTLV